MRTLVLGIIVGSLVAAIAIAVYANKGKLTSKADEDTNQILLASVFEPPRSYKFYNATTNPKAIFKCPEGWSGPTYSYEEFLYLGPNENGMADDDDGLTYVLFSDASNEIKTPVGGKIGLPVSSSDDDNEYLDYPKKILTVTVKTKLPYDVTTTHDYGDGEPPTTTTIPMFGEASVEGPTEEDGGSLRCSKPKKECKEKKTSLLAKPAYAATPCPTSDTEAF